MITFSTREISNEEKALLAKRSPSLYKRIEEYVMMFIGIMIVLLLPLLLIDKYVHVSAGAQAVSCICMLVLTFFVIRYIRRKYGVPAKKRDEINLVEVIRVNTARAIKREDPEDFGTAYYLDVTHNGQKKVLYLWGQYLDELEENTFPNSSFEIAREKDSEEFINFQLLGHYFIEEKVLPPFDAEVWKNGNYPVNGQLLNICIDEIA